MVTGSSVVSLGVSAGLGVASALSFAVSVGGGALPVELDEEQADNAVEKRRKKAASII
ncbi:hypothetical protein J21TS3_11520 [Paenibacillus cookii]|uniref:Uncharacterized protein n=1 Tax=Paenibacillus cookii TaxID=157839 RepID=A0ABQ4LU96_9BACL|nr:hypothetical protein J21TS3_11520 [Paenibacillus cookii]